MGGCPVPANPGRTGSLDRAPALKLYSPKLTPSLAPKPKEVGCLRPPTARLAEDRPV
jgi:hypothetical protein